VFHPNDRNEEANILSEELAHPEVTRPDGIAENGLEVLAGFIVWLARQDIPEVRRADYHDQVERYLGWRAGAGPGSPAASEFVVEMVDHPGQPPHARASLGLLRRYLLAASSRRVGSANPLWSRLPAELAR
jgi:hypothetical protein